MRPSSAIFDPGLERAAPWGRDLFTFVTSAAGYMMRTLQKPRKNKPSKRQVNHRRFLHNMIQRKFAEIEAANQQLASVLLTVGSETQRRPDAKSSHSSESEKNNTNAGETKTSKKHQDKENDVDPRTVNNLVVNSSKSHFNIKQSNHSNSKTDHQPRKAQNDSSHMSHFTYRNGFLEDSVIHSPLSLEAMGQDSTTQTRTRSNEEEENSLGLSCLDLTSLHSRLSTDSFDLSVQTDGGRSVRIRSITDPSELDVMDNFDFLDFSDGTGGTGRTDEGPVWDTQSEGSQSFFRDTPAILNSLYEDQSEGDVAETLQQITSLSEDSEWTSGDGSENNMLYFGSICDEDETKLTGATVDIDQHQVGLTAPLNTADQYLLAGSWTRSDAIKNSGETGDVSSRSPTELGLSDRFQMKSWDRHIQEDRHHPQSMDTAPYGVLMDDRFEMPNLSPDYPGFLSASAHCRNSTPQDFGSHPSADTDQSFPSFDGVAQSFPAPVRELNPYPVLTPPLNDDWLFSNIVTEDDLAGTVRSPGRSSCWRSCTMSNEYAVGLD